MAKKKLSELPTLGSVPTGSAVPFVTGGASAKATIENVVAGGLGMGLADIGQAFNVCHRTFGAVAGGGGNAAANRTAMQAAINACASLTVRGVVVIPAGVYLMPSGLGLTLPSNVSLRGEGESTVLDWSLAVATTVMVSATGTIGTSVPLAGNAALRSKDLDVSGAAFADGDWALVFSEAVMCSNGLRKGEIVQVDVASTMTLKDPLQDDYATADTASIAKLTLVENVSVVNIKFLGPTSTAVIATGVVFDRVLNGRVAGCSFEQTQNAGVSITESVGIRVNDFYANKNELSSTAYGVVVNNAACNVQVTNAQGWRLRHLVTGGGFGSRYGGPRRVTVTCCQAFQCLQSGFDTHGGCEDWQFGDCHVLGSLNDGFTAEGVTTTITGCSTKHCVGPAIRMRSFNIKPYKCTVTGGTFEGMATATGSRGVELEIVTGFENIEAINVSGATFTDMRYGFRHINATAVPTRGLNVSGNIYTRCALNSESVIFIINAVKPVCNGNTLHDASVGSDGVSYQDVTGGTVVGNTIELPGTGTCRAIRMLGTTTRVTIEANEASGGSNSQGISIADTCSSCSVGAANNLLGCTVGLVLGTGTGHAVEIKTVVDVINVNDDYNLPNITFPQHRIVEVDVAAGTWSDAADKVTLPVTPIRGERVTISAIGNALAAGDNVDIDSGDTILGDSLINTNNGSRTYVALSDTTWRLMSAA